MNPNGTISEILHHKGGQVWSVSPETMVFDAIQLMADKNIGALLVTQADKLVGILTERDYTRKVALKGKSSKQTPVKEILSGQVIHVNPDHTVEDWHEDHDRPSGPPLAGARRRSDRGRGFDWRPRQLDHYGPEQHD